MRRGTGIGGALRHVLIFEPDARGHAEEWVVHIARFVLAARPSLRVTFVLPEALCTRLRTELRGGGAYDLYALHPHEIDRCLKRGLMLGALARWSLMRRYVAVSGAREGIFLCLDSLSLPLALGFGLGRALVSGILFRPSVHYESLGVLHPTWRERLRDVRKHVLYPLMLKNKTLSAVYSLDPYFPGYARKRYVYGEKVVALADPMFGRPNRPSTAPSSRHFPDRRVRFVLFGELTARKGALQLLHACRLLKPDVACEIAILLAGRIDPGIASKVRKIRDDLRERQSELWLKIEDRRLSFAELAHVVEETDVVLAPYQRFVGSSGVLIWAAFSERPVITQKYGLVGRLVCDFGLGLVADTASPKAIAEALEHAVRRGPQSLIDPRGARTFLAGRDANTFVARILNATPADANAHFTTSRATSARAVQTTP